MIITPSTALIKAAHLTVIRIKKFFKNKCYFCGKRVKEYTCKSCSDLPGLTYVMSGEMTWMWIPAVAIIYLQIDEKDYEVKLFINDDLTHVNHDSKRVIDLKGFPITPQNAPTKLKTILTFM